jgi:hypothetical protein
MEDLHGSPEPGSGERGNRLYEFAAFFGVFGAFLGPAILLLAGARALTAATVGYLGIALFAGGVAARYGFVRHRRPFVQLGGNVLIAMLVTGVFYAGFLILTAL